MRRQVAYLLVYGHLPRSAELDRWSGEVMRHSAVPTPVEAVVQVRIKLN